MTQCWRTLERSVLVVCALTIPTLGCGGGEVGSEGSAGAAADESGMTPAVEAEGTRESGASPGLENRSPAAPPAATLDEVPDACSLLGEQEVGELLEVDASELEARSIHNPNQWRSQCDWRVGSGRALSRWVILNISAGYSRVEYETGIAALPYWTGGREFTTEDYVDILTVRRGKLIEYDPELGDGAYLVSTDSGIFLRVETSLALASVPEAMSHEPKMPDKLILEFTISGSDDWAGDRAQPFALDLAARILEELESKAS